MLRVNQTAQGNLQDLLEETGVGIFECQQPATGQHYQVIRPSEGVAVFLDTSKTGRGKALAATTGFEQQPWTIKKISELPTSPIQLASG